MNTIRGWENCPKEGGRLRLHWHLFTVALLNSKILSVEETSRGVMQSRCRSARARPAIWTGLVRTYDKHVECGRTVKISTPTGMCKGVQYESQGFVAFAVPYFKVRRSFNSFNNEIVVERVERIYRYKRKSPKSWVIFERSSTTVSRPLPHCRKPAVVQLALNSRIE